MSVHAPPSFVLLVGDQGLDKEIAFSPSSRRRMTSTKKTMKESRRAHAVFLPVIHAFILIGRWQVEVLKWRHDMTTWDIVVEVELVSLTVKYWLNPIFFILLVLIGLEHIPIHREELSHDMQVGGSFARLHMYKRKVPFSMRYFWGYLSLLQSNWNITEFLIELWEMWLTILPKILDRQDQFQFLSVLNCVTYWNDFEIILGCTFSSTGFSDSKVILVRR